MCWTTLTTRYVRGPFGYILSIPLGILALYGLLLSSIPSYISGPDSQAFFQTQKNKIITIASTYSPQEYIQIKTDGSSKKIDIFTGQQEQELLKEKSLIQYISPTTWTQTQVFFLSKNGCILEFFPQSSTEIQGLYPNHMQVSPKEGKISFLVPEEEKPSISLLATGEKISNELNTLQKTFRQNEIYFFKKQRGNPVFYNPISIQIQQEILDLAWKIFPQIYTEKRQNFLAYRQAIDLPLQQKTSVQTDTTEATQEMIKQGNRGREETKLYQRIHTFF